MLSTLPAKAFFWQRLLNDAIASLFIIKNVHYPTLRMGFSFFGFVHWHGRLQ